MITQTEELLVGIALRAVAERYALAVDTGDGDLFAAQFTPDGVLESPRGRFEGHASLATVPLLLRERYVETFHAVHNQVAHLSKDGAQAVTYCIARHFWSSGTGASCEKVDPVFRKNDALPDRGSIGLDPQSGFHFWVRCSSGLLCYEMTIRYLDSFVQEKKQWRLALRKLVVVGTRTFPMEAARLLAPEE